MFFLCDAFMQPQSLLGEFSEIKTKNTNTKYKQALMYEKRITGAVTDACDNIASMVELWLIITSLAAN